MNTNHYPDIERCKKLTEIGFPMTVKAEATDEVYYNYGIKMYKSIYIPSVMEMLDVIDLHVIITKKDNHAMVTVEIPGDKPHHFVDTLPNALADLIFWLHENNYIKF